MSRCTYSIPGFFEDAEIKDNKIKEPGLLGRTLYVIKGNKICKPGLLGATVLEIKGKYIKEPGIFGKTLFYLEKDGRVREPKFLGKTVGAFPVFESENLKSVEPETMGSKFNSSHEDTSWDDYDIKWGFHPETAPHKEIRVPLKHKKLAGMPINCEVERIYLHKNVSEVSPNVWCSKEYIVDPENEYFTSINGVLYSKDLKTLITIPSELNDFNVLKIPDTVTTLATGCRCYKGEALFIPKGIKEIKDIEEMNRNYGLLDDIIVEEGNESFKTVDGVLYSIDGHMLYLASKALKWKKWKMPDTVTEIASYAFFGSLIRFLIIPSSVKRIGKNAFDCSHLIYAYVPNSVEKIEHWAFARIKNAKIEFEAPSEKESWDPEWTWKEGAYTKNFCFSISKPTETSYEELRKKLKSQSQEN